MPLRPRERTKPSSSSRALVSTSGPAPWTFEARPVEVGSQDGPQTVVQKGLKPGERVVVKGGVLLND